MTTPILFAFPGNEALAPCIGATLGAEIGEIEVRHFPDGESYVRFDNDVEDRPVILLTTLARPDDKIMPLLFTAMSARNQGARRIGLVAPYLAYMRQDRRFKPGEAITSLHFARLMSETFDWLITVDPHLHRYQSLDELYTIPAQAVSSAPLIADWIKRKVTDPVLLGPDGESAQWVASVARDAGNIPYTVLTKTRLGDRDVRISLPDKAILKGRTPVLVDDIISTAGTMAEAASHVRDLGAAAPVCVAIHGIFAGDAWNVLKQAGVGTIATTNTIPHPTNAIDVSGLLAEAARDMLPG